MNIHIKAFLVGLGVLFLLAGFLYVVTQTSILSSVLLVIFLIGFVYCCGRFILQGFEN